ncbi:hypothetical protein AWA2045_31220 (plasmid) [Lactiplantibacillus plantarum]|nr:hypothetical protein AWA2045_31220 [Lactiplantibacillus plantarum]
MNNAPKKPTLAKFDDIITMINTAVDPAIKSTSFLLTNTSGFNVLSEVKGMLWGVTYCNPIQHNPIGGANSW